MLLAFVLDWATELPRPWIAGGLALYVAKDFALYPWVRRAYEASAHEPGTELVGLTGRVVVALAPEGWVELRHERWRARAENESAMLEAGTAVRVCRLDGHTLRVEPLEGGAG